MEILLLLMTLFSGHGEYCQSGVFGYKGDTMTGGVSPCIDRKVLPNDVGIAHRTLPCGTKVLLYVPRNKQVITTKVVDRGPYGAISKNRWVLKRKASDEGKWRGCVDIMHDTAQSLKHNGFEMVYVVPVPKFKNNLLLHIITSRITSDTL